MAVSIPNDWLFPGRDMDVAAYLKAAKSPRANDLPDFADWISDAAKQYDLNPRWFLMLAEKEQSFLSRKADGSQGWVRACAYTLGYGATDSHDIPKYKGTRTQVYAAAKGLRGYLTPGTQFSVWPLLGQPFECPDGIYFPQTFAEAAALRYTPWIKYLGDVVSVWNALERRAPAEWNATGGTTMPKYDVATAAEMVVAARKQGQSATTLNGVDFDLTESGMCSRFVRLCHKAAELPTNAFSCCAHSTGQHLRGAGRDIGDLQRGAIVVFTNGGPRCSTCGQDVWHIGIYLGDGALAENTSSGSRGDPRAKGTKISPLSAVGPDRIWGIFSLEQPGIAAAYADGEIVVVIVDVPWKGLLQDGVAYLGNPKTIPVRELEKVGAAVYDHIVESRRVYVYKAGK